MNNESVNEHDVPIVRIAVLEFLFHSVFAFIARDSHVSAVTLALVGGDAFATFTRRITDC